MRWSRWTCWRRAGRTRDDVVSQPWRVRSSRRTPSRGVGLEWIPASPGRLGLGALTPKGALQPQCNHQSATSWNGTYRPVASVAAGVSRPDEAWSCLRVLSQTASATQQTAKPNQITAPHIPSISSTDTTEKIDTRSLSLDNWELPPQCSATTTTTTRSHCKSTAREDAQPLC